VLIGNINQREWGGEHSGGGRKSSCIGGSNGRVGLPRLRHVQKGGAGVIGGTSGLGCAGGQGSTNDRRAHRFYQASWGRARIKEILFLIPGRASYVSF